MCYSVATAEVAGICTVRCSLYRGGRGRTVTRKLSIRAVFIIIMVATIRFERILSVSKTAILPLDDTALWRKTDYSKTIPLGTLRLAGEPDTLSVNLPYGSGC